MRVLVLINGAPGSGKSTIASRLAGRRPMALALDVDGIKHALGRWEADPVASGLQARRLALAMARWHLRDGHDVLVGQYLAKTEFIEELEEVAKDCAASFVEVVLTRDAEVLRQRLEERHLRPDRPEHAANNRLTSPDAAQEYIYSLSVVKAARSGMVAVDASGPIDEVADAVERLLP